jgi:glucose/arabinose dehydrogenase
MIRITLLFLLITISSCTKSTLAQEQKPIDYTHKIIYKGLANPWGLAELNTGSWLITERKGNLKLWENNKIYSVIGVPNTVFATGQGGLMDILIHQETNEKAIIYFTATNLVGNLHSTAIFKADYIKAKRELKNVEKIYQASPLDNSIGHFGSRLVIDENNYLFLGLGERQKQDLAQDNKNSSGCVVRLYLNGAVPSDNPFTDVDSIPNEIWSYGHRNIQGMVIHPETKEIWSHEHGPRGGDEINIIQKAQNYGWPLACYGVNYDGTPVSPYTHYPGTKQPEFYWTPSIAPCGMEIYSGKVFTQWKNHIFVGALAKQHVNRLTIKNNKVYEAERLFQDFGRFRAIKEGNDGCIYLLSEGNGGVFSRIEPVH